MQTAMIVALYLIGLIGLHAVTRDLQRGPIKTRRAWACLILWPIVIPIAKIGDLYDYLAGIR